MKEEKNTQKSLVNQNALLKNSNKSYTHTTRIQQKKKSPFFDMYPNETEKEKDEKKNPKSWFLIHVIRLISFERV